MKEKFATEKSLDEIIKRVEKLEGLFNQNQVKISSRKESIVEFYKRYNSKTDPERYSIFMAFLENNGTEGSNNKTVKDLFKEAKQKIPKNVTDVRNQLNKKGWIQCIDKKNKLYSLTQTGLEGLEKIKK